MPGQLRGARCRGWRFREQTGSANQLAKHRVDQPHFRRAEQRFRPVDCMVDNPCPLPLLSGGRTGFEQLEAGDEEDCLQPGPGRPRDHRFQQRVQPPKIPDCAKQEMLAPCAPLPVRHKRGSRIGRLCRRSTFFPMGPRLAGESGPPPPAGLFQQGVDPAASPQPVFEQRD